MTSVSPNDQRSTLRRSSTTTAMIAWIARFDCIVPFRVECITFDGELAHLVVADSDPFLVGPLVERTFDLQASLVVVLAISSITVVRLSSGCPRQFCVMWQNMRCSILFHFE